MPLTAANHLHATARRGGALTCCRASSVRRRTPTDLRHTVARARRRPHQLLATVPRVLAAPPRAGRRIRDARALDIHGRIRRHRADRRSGRRVGRLDPARPRCDRAYGAPSGVVRMRPSAIPRSGPVRVRADSPRLTASRQDPVGDVTAPVRMTRPSLKAPGFGRALLGGPRPPRPARCR